MMLRWSSIRNIARISQRCSYTTSSASESAKVDENLEDVEKEKSSASDAQSSAKQSRLVAAAFASLQMISHKTKPGFTFIEEKLSSAQDVNSLLSIAEQPVVTKNHAYRVRFPRLLLYIAVNLTRFRGNNLYCFRAGTQQALSLGSRKKVRTRGISR